jgi:hypothetical protein
MYPQSSMCGETDNHENYVEKLTQSRKLMWRNWHNHENLCGETDTITKIYVEKLTIMKTYVEKLTQSWTFMRRNWHNHENLFGETDTITKTYVEKLTIIKIRWLDLHNHENLCGETDTITKTYVEKLTQSRKLM